MTETDDQELPRQESSLQLPVVLERIDQNDSVAEELLYQKFASRLVRLASSRIEASFQSKISADDIVQSVFRSFFARYEDKRVSFNNWNELWSFLAKVTIRKCHQKTRWYLREKRSVNREIQEGNDDVKMLTRLAISQEPSAEQVAVFSEMLEMLLEPLTPLQREMAGLKLQGFSNEKIAESLGRTERTVYRLLNLLRNRMREMDQAD